MLPAGHEDRLSPMFDPQPADPPIEVDGPVSAVALLGPRSRIFAQGKIIGHILPMIATTEESAGQKSSRPVHSIAYDEM